MMPGFTVAVALLVFNNRFFDFVGITAGTAEFDAKMVEKTGKTAEEVRSRKVARRTSSNFYWQECCFIY